jgi:hypothetical protein
MAMCGATRNVGVVAGLALAASSCVFAVGNEGMQGPGKESGERIAEGSVKGGKGKDGKKSALEVAEHELVIARMELELAESKAKGEKAEAKEDVAHKQAEAAQAAAALELFKALERPLKLAQAQLEIDQASNSLWEAEEELKELLSMYKKEQFAEITKELVVQRKQKQIEIVKRRLELERKDKDRLERVDLYEKELDLAEAWRKTEVEHELALKAVKRAELESRIGIEKARAELEKKERELVDLRGSGPDKARKEEEKAKKEKEKDKSKEKDKEKEKEEVKEEEREEEQEEEKEEEKEEEAPEEHEAEGVRTAGSPEPGSRP